MRAFQVHMAHFCEMKGPCISHLIPHRLKVGNSSDVFTTGPLGFVLTKRVGDFLFL